MVIAKVTELQHTHPQAPTHTLTILDHVLTASI